MGSYTNLRMRSIFKRPEDTQTPGMSLPKRFISGVTREFDPDEPPEETENNQYYADLERMRSEAANAPGRSAYMKGLESQPRESSYPVSKKRKAGGILAGIAGGILNGGVRGGMDSYDRVAKAPYHRAMREWETEMEGKTQAAKFEESDMANQMKNWHDARKLGLDYSDYRRKVDKDRDDYNISQGQLRETNRRNTGEIGHWNRSDETAAAGQRDTSKYRDRLTDIGGFNAQTNRMGQQATMGIGMRNAAANESRADTYKKTAGNRQPSSVQQAYARDNAFAELYNDSRFRDFIRREADGRFGYNPDITQEQSNSLMYQEFRKRMEAAINNAKESGNPIYDEQDDDDGSIIIGPRGSWRR